MGEKNLQDANAQDDTVVARPRARARRAAAQDDATVALAHPAAPDDATVALARPAARQGSTLAFARTATAGAAELPIALPAGYRLHEYRINSVLGQGGFGITYLATDVNLDAKVAIKEYLPSSLAGRSRDSSVHPRAAGYAELFAHGLDRFLFEARTLATFRHPNIVRVARFFEANQTAYMVLDYERGQSLKAWWAAHPLPETELLMRLHPLLDGLDLVHRNGILHRDIKPDNLRVRDEDGSFVLLDFGSAYAAQSGSEEAAGIVTPGYAPVEQYMGQRQGPATDLYGFAATLYWLVCGRAPREAPHRIAAPQADVPAERVGAGRYSLDFLRAIDWALQPHASARPQSVRDFRRALFAAHASSLGLQEALAVSGDAHGELRGSRALAGRLLRFGHRLRHPASWPLALKMSLAMVLAALLPMMITGYHNLQGSLDVVSRAELRSLEHLAQSTAGRISQLIDDSRRVAAFLAADRDVAAYLAEPGEAAASALLARLQGLVSANPDVHLAIIMDRHGTALVSTDAPSAGRNYAFREYFKTAMAGHPYASGIIVGSVAGLAGVYLSHPVRAQNGGIVGVVVLRLKARAVAGIVDAAQASDRVPFLIDGDGVLIHHPDAALRFHSLAPLAPKQLAAIVADQRFRRDRIDSLDMPPLARAMVGAQHDGNVSYRSTISGVEEVAGYAPVSGQDWVVGITETRKTFEQPLQRVFNQVLYSVFLVGAVFVLLALLFARSIVRPVERLTGAADALKRGDYDGAHVAVTSGDELGRLARTFNVMIDVLRQRERERRLGHDVGAGKD